MHNKEQDKRAVIYLRRAVQDEDASFESAFEQQRARCWACAERHGLRVVEEYVEVAGTGHTITRPGLKALLNRLTDDPVPYVLADDRARLSRSRADEQRLLDQLTACSITVLYASECIEGNQDEHPHIYACYINEAGQTEVAGQFIQQLLAGFARAISVEPHTPLHENLQSQDVRIRQGGQHEVTT